MKLKVNKELLVLTLQTIKDNPQHWNQRNWHCGTSHCYAGMAQLLHLGLDYTKKLDRTNFKYKTALYNIATPSIQRYVDNGGDIEYTFEYAESVLGLDRKTSNLLFDALNTLQDLESMVSYILIHDSLEGYIKAE